MFTTYAEYPDLAATARKLFKEIEKVPLDHDIVLDFYLWHREALPQPDTTEEKVAVLLREAGFPRAIRRIVVAVGGPGKTLSELQYFTYRPSDGAYQEEKLYRGLHPMMGKRLHLWRLNNFKIERLPSVEDVYLIHAVARDNPKDERLFACAEVRDVTPVRDDGRTSRATAASGAHVNRSDGGASDMFQSRRAPARAPVLEPDSPLRMAAARSEAGRIARHRAPTGSGDRRPGPGAGGGACTHSKPGNRRVARHDGAHLEPRWFRAADHLPSRRQAATPEAADATTSRKLCACGSAG